jgi:hypothetical protein
MARPREFDETQVLNAAFSIVQAPADFARLLLSVHIGIRILARCRPDRALLEGLARPALALLDPIEGKADHNDDQL